MSIISPLLRRYKHLFFLTSFNTGYAYWRKTGKEEGFKEEKEQTERKRIRPCLGM